MPRKKKAVNPDSVRILSEDEGEEVIFSAPVRKPVDPYQARKEAERARQAEMSETGRDIGALPPVADPERKERCRLNFQAFCEEYFPEVFNLGWSPDHIKVIRKIEQSVLRGGLFALAMARGSGKSTLNETGCIWAMAYAHRRFPMLIGATESAAMESLDSIKTEFEVNELLAEDFPEICYPIAALEGIANRCAGQICNGLRTRITWTSKKIVLPTIEGAATSGIVVQVAGLTGRIRGAKYKTATGQSVRPDLVIIDDPQTEESAASVEQTAKRVRILSGDILGLAGPGKKIAGIMPCTVIRPGDMADQILDRKKHPEWQGERCRMMISLPTNVDLWNRYADLRAAQLDRDGTFTEATEFYRANQAAMDEGAQASWEERKQPDELTAIQSAMNLKLTNEAAFFAEYQNDPLPEDMGQDDLLSEDFIDHKLNGIDRLTVPLECDKVTMYIDVQKTVLFYVVTAWNDDFTGAVIDYGTWPDQKRRYFTLKDITYTFERAFPHAGLEGRIYSALEALVNESFQRVFFRADGTELHLDRCVIDANWGFSTDTVYQFCRQSPFTASILPSHGVYVGAATKPMNDRKKIPGETAGLNWRICKKTQKRVIRHLLIDTNYWKSFVMSRLSTAQGDRGCLSLWGRDPARHQLFAQHLTSEIRVKTQGRGRTVDEWKLQDRARDNHWFDCLVGCAVAASIEGSKAPGVAVSASAPAKPKKLKLSEIRKSILARK